MPKSKEEEGKGAEDIAKLRRHLRILVDLARLARAAVTDRFLDEAVVQVARATEVDHVKVLCYRPKKADLLIVAGVGWKEGVVGSTTFPIDLRSVGGRAFQTGEPVVVEDTADPGELVIHHSLQEHGIASLANVPILVDGAAWGVLEVDSSRLRSFSDDTLDFMSAASAIIGAVIQRRKAEQGQTAALAELAAEAQAREVLLRELQHRVKNNFQIILASVTLQKRRFDNPEVNRALAHVVNRISAISLAHDQLAAGQATHAVDLSDYLGALCASIEQQIEDVIIEVQAEKVELTIERAVPLGLIVNETVTNSVKHAFGEKGGRVTVKLETGVGLGEARLIVSDNGRGIDKPRPGGSGLKLVASLARQIGAELEQQSSPGGTTTTVTFPVIA